MPGELNEAALKLIDDPKNFAHVATIMKDGSPQVTPVWVSAADGAVYINSAEGRLKVLNLRRDGRVAVEVSNAENPYNYVAVRGKVVEMTHDDADEHIDALAKKYMGVDSYPLRKATEQRVKIKIQPEHVQVSDPGA